MSFEVEPGNKFEFNQPNVTPLDRQKLIDTLTVMINQSAPYLEGIVIHNNTKTCKVSASISDRRLHITLTNPQDEEFRL